MKRIAVYCGAKSGARQIYRDEAEKLGKLFAIFNIELVYGGGHVGLMGVVADASIAHGGKAIGVIPENLVEQEQAHTTIQDLRIVPGMHERKALMAELADGFIALPGGFGTLEEFFEVLTWSQIGYHTKKVVLINLNGFYDSLLMFIDHAIQEGFILPEYSKMLVVTSSAEEAVGKFIKPD